MISKIIKPTPLCAGVVVIPKKSGAVRIFIDLKPLNESVFREPHPIPKVDDTLALYGATVFSKLLTNSGFWQIPLSKTSHTLTMSITPLVRYHFNKLPFGIFCAPELFQRRINTILEGLEGIVCPMDDVFIFISNKDEYDTWLMAVLQQLKKASMTLNFQKC